MYLSNVSNKAISDYLTQKGIFHSSQGYKCLMFGIRGILDGTVDRNCAKAIYDYVAVKVGVKPGQVDRAIRHAIRKTAQPAPNKEFLLRAADDLAFSADAHAFLFGSSAEPSG